MDPENLVDVAARTTSRFRKKCMTTEDFTIEKGFLYGTAELVLELIGLKDNEKYHIRREELAREIDKRSTKDTNLDRLTSDEY